MSNPACVCWTGCSGLWGSGWCFLGQDHPRCGPIWCTRTRRLCWLSQTCPEHTHTHTQWVWLKCIIHFLTMRLNVSLYIPCPPDFCLDGISGPIWNTLSLFCSLHAFKKKSTHTNHQMTKITLNKHYFSDVTVSHEKRWEREMCSFFILNGQNGMKRSCANKL